MLYIRKASQNDWDEISIIYAQARKFMAEHGNAGQWGKTNPPEDVLRQNIEDGNLYVCMSDEVLEHADYGMAKEYIAAVFYFAIEEDPTYAIIEDGAWLNQERYGVVHRIASARMVRGAASFCMKWAMEQIPNIRIDTHENNIPMQNMLKKNGFSYCGRIYLANGDPRIAFQKCSLD